MFEKDIITQIIIFNLEAKYNNLENGLKKFAYFKCIQQLRERIKNEKENKR